MEWCGRDGVKGRGTCWNQLFCLLVGPYGCCRFPTTDLERQVKNNFGGVIRYFIGYG